KSVEIISTGMDIAERRITVSTAGYAPKIRRLADERRRVKLAISLHTLDERMRTSLMPINRKFPLAEVLDAAAHYYRTTRQRITFEYILFDGWNDREEDLRLLIALSRRIPSKINLIPFHSIDSTRPVGIAAELRPT